MTNLDTQSDRMNPKVSVVIPAKNESKTIAHVIKQVKNVHSNLEIIVVVNGSTDRTAEIAEQMGAIVIHYPIALGHGVGRSIGAKEAKGDIILFIDGDIVISSELLMPFVKAVENGADIALNTYQGPENTKNVSSIALSKWVLNSLLFSTGLGSSSMTTIPHAISRNALEVIGYDNLAVPPKAQAIAISSGLHVTQACFVDIRKINRKRRESPNPVIPLIVGDHLEAIHWMLSRSDPRVNRTDLGRQRERVRD
ncbi:glycosyltransferase family 2 protein [Paenibacillus sp. N3.4]|uniref:glycosyltransferase family 2 protein n=1 Tax=Paenibacillus sp. N3.4 TaxID=2603222 RepID=UPI0011CC3D1E|nr:glycosyltransferase family 2 protein [Paenibacillus sp. N3.4]TXK84639.1 glycosyltransferase [Paenibacillus sp. N3.4]